MAEKIQFESMIHDDDEEDFWRILAKNTPLDFRLNNPTIEI